MDTLTEKYTEHVLDTATDWDIWRTFSSTELATTVAYYADLLLNDTEARAGLYELLNTKPLEKLNDRDVPSDSRVLWVVKDETEHPGGAYKLRGAYCNLVMQLDANPSIKQVHCTSTGNHGRSVATVCQWLNENYGTDLEAIVHVPKSISPVKLRALEASGATILAAESFEVAHQETEDLKVVSAQSNATVAVIEPYDDLRTMAGQASCGFEIVADFAGDLFGQEGVDLEQDEITLWVPGGGGGFAAGCAVAINHYRRLGLFGTNVRVKVAQMEHCDALARAYRGEAPLTADTIDTASDATALLAGGVLTQRILADMEFVADVVSVPKRYVGLAMETLERHHGHPVEPAGALSLAASLWREDIDPRREDDPRRVHVTVTSGANVTEETRSHFADSVTPDFRSARQSLVHLRREVHGVDEVLARRKAGRTAVHKLLVANGLTGIAA